MLNIILGLVILGGIIFIALFVFEFAFTLFIMALSGLVAMVGWVVDRIHHV